ncbi:MAG: hypothetical protein K2L41_00745 [Muribaculaceae bacterium]|nr:hypothetical protein [Muribaculaceae bacterium]
MEKRNFFTSGWLFLSLAILNLAVAGISSPLIMSSPGGLDEWFSPLCFLFPMSIALAIVSIFLPRPRIGVKRVLTIVFNAMSAILYIMAIIAIVGHWIEASEAYYI